MAWLYQGVLNSGLQILLSIFAGWLCARLRLFDPEVMSRNVNAFAMKAAYPAFIIHLLGVKTDLRDGEAWRALGAFVLWVLIIHLACLTVHRLRGKRSSVLQLGLNCLLLTTNNTGCIGWPVLIATVGQQSAVLSMLLGVLFFVQLLPVAICCFETDKWQHAEGQQLTLAAGRDLNDLHTEDQQLPVAQGGKDLQWALPGTTFPHEFRYCYWSNELYQPRGAPSSYAPLNSSSAGGGKQAIPPAALAEVCVESGDDTEDEGAADHHCFGGSSRAPSRSSTCSSFDQNPHGNAGGNNISISSKGGSQGGSVAHAAPAGREWWRAGRPASLKRAKDSCDSLYTPFAAAAVAEKQAQFEQQQLAQHRPSTLGLSSLTRRLSKSLTAAGAAAAAATTASAATAAASISGLMKAASLHTAGSLSRAQSLKRTVSLKPAASLRRSGAGAAAAAAKDPSCQMSVPLMSEHSDTPPSCCASHRGAASPHGSDAQQPDAAGAAAWAGEGGGLTDAGARSRDSSSGGIRSSSSADSHSSSSGGGGSAGNMPAAAAPGSAAGRPGHRTAFGQQWATDSAVELHCMCDSLSNEAGKLQWQPAAQLGDKAGQQGAAVQGSGSYGRAADVPVGKGSGLHTLCGEELSSCSSRDTNWVSSRTNILASSNSRSNLLPSGGITSSGGGAAAKGASKLGKSARGAAQGSAAAAAAVAAAAAAGSAGNNECAACTAKSQQAKQQQQQRPNIVQRFGQRHPLLCHIVWGQLQSLHLWLNIIAIALSVSGVRKYLDPQAPEAIPALGFVDGVLSWFSAACIPTLLFANGVWMCGKDILCGGWRGQVKVLSLLLLKLTLLPALMIGLTLLCGIRGPYGLSLVLLASCPLAPLAFLVCQQYGYGAELSTAITIQGVLLMLPQMMAVIKINQMGGLYDVKMLGT